MSTSANGYAYDPPLARAFTLTSHAPLIYAIFLAWKIREDVPFLLYSLIACFVASNYYHACYQYQTCYFDDIMYHRHLDYYCSLMAIQVLFTVALWRRRIVGKAPTPPWLRVVSRWKCSRRRRAFFEPILRHQVPANVDDPGSGSTVLEYYRPWIVNPLTFLMHVINAYVHIHQGIGRLGSLTSFIIALVVFGGFHIGEIVRFKLKMRVGVFFLVATPFAISYFVFFTDERFGAIGHSMWHFLGMSGIALYLKFLPIFVEHDGSHVFLGFE